MKTNVRVIEYEYSKSMNMTFARLDTPSFVQWWSVSGNVPQGEFISTVLPAIKAKMERDGMDHEMALWRF